MLQLFTAIYHDVVGVSYCRTERVRDLTTVRSRLLLEGLSFLTKTLPSLGKAIDRSLSSGLPLQVHGFARSRGSQLPRFLGKLFEEVYRLDGTLREKSDDRSDATDLSPCEGPQVAALKALRQLCFVFYKLEIPFTDEQVTRTLKSFVTTDHELPDDFDHLASTRVADLKLARNLISEILSSADPHRGIPRHGPGAVATGESQLDKSHFKRFYTRLNAEYAYDEWFYYNHDHLCDSLSELQALEVLEAGTAKVVLVPKDSRGPRLISCEPLEYQWIQQAQMDVLVTHLERHPLTRGRVNFTRQDINQDLAIEGSISGCWETLDLKDASDRVSLALVKALFPDNWYRALYASRSPATMLPDGTIVQLKKFAPMGSAVCFPVEALVFFALCVAVQINRQGSSRSDALRGTFVYGDDLIVRGGNHAAIDQCFMDVGLKLNSDKCCVGARFKESCGVDAFDGYNVTPLRWKSTATVIRDQDLSTFVAFSNAAWKRGWWMTAQLLEDAVRRRYFVPTFDHDNPGCIGFVRPEFDASRVNPRRKMRYNRKLHRREVLGPRLRVVEKSTTRTGWELMLRSEAIRIRSSPKDDEGGLRSTSHVSPVKFSGRYPLAYRYNLEYAWTPVAA